MAIPRPFSASIPPVIACIFFSASLLSGIKLRASAISMKPLPIPGIAVPSAFAPLASILAALDLLGSVFSAIFLRWFSMFTKIPKSEPSGDTALATYAEDCLILSWFCKDSFSKADLKMDIKYYSIFTLYILELWHLNARCFHTTHVRHFRHL